MSNALAKVAHLEHEIALLKSELRRWDRVIDAARIYDHGDDGSLERLAAEISDACQADQDHYASYRIALHRFGVTESPYHHANNCEYCSGGVA